MTFMPEEPPRGLRVSITLLDGDGTKKCGLEGVAAATASHIRILIRSGRTSGTLFTKDGVVAWEKIPDDAGEVSP